MRESERIYVSRAYNIVTSLGLAMHIIFACIFVLLHVEGMFWYNIIITMFYVLFLRMIGKRQYRLVVTLVHLEVCTFVVVSTLFLGWNYGFVFYLIALTALVYFNPFAHQIVIWFFPALELSVFFLLKILTAGSLPLLKTAPKMAVLFEFINSLGCFTIIFLGAFVSKVSLKNMQQERDRFAYDSLTGVYVREHFIHRVEATLKENPDKDYILFSTNIVGFKFYNEIFGEEMGNEVLKTQAFLLREAKEEHIWFGRVAGDGFAVLAEADKFDENRLMENSTLLQDRFGNDLYQLHIHTGIYHISREEPVSIMLDKTEIAVKSLQGKYGTCCAYYTEDMLEKSLHERRVLSEFEQALKEGQFCFYLQPQFSREGGCLGAEALVRWNHPDKGLVFPGDFIPILESTGLIWKLDQYIWEEAVKKLKEWQSLRGKKASISVNISPKDFFYLDIYQVFTSLVEKYEIQPKYLKLEITESVFLEDTKKQLALIGHLQKYGFDIEIDDFGSGFSSLNLLKDIKANILKIDMAFLEETENMQRSWIILNSIIDLAGRIGMETLTEGVETQTQMVRLKQVGCDMFQGYYFSRPIPVKDFEARFL